MTKETKQVSVLFMLFSILFCVCLIAANVLETKQIQVGPFSFGRLVFPAISLTGGLIVFPVSYIINDCVCEVWGYGKARLLIWLGFVIRGRGSLVRLDSRGCLLGQRCRFPCRLRIGSAHRRRFFRGLPLRVVHECLCDEPHEDCFPRAQFLCPRHSQHGGRRGH